MTDLTAVAHREPILVYNRIAQNRRKTWLLLAGLAIAVLPSLLFIAAYFGELVLITVAILGWLPESAGSDENILGAFALSAAASLALALIVAYATYYLATAMVLSTSGARPLAADEDRRLQRIVENLCIGAGLPQPRLHVIESAATNAYSTGSDPEHAALVVTRGLLDTLDDRELEGVVAQELSQIGNEDVRPGTLAGAVAMILCPVFLLLFIIKGFLPRLFRRGQIVGIAVLIILSPVLLALFYFALTQLLMVAFLPLILASLLELKELYAEFAGDPRGRLIIGMFALHVYVWYIAPVIGFLMRRGVCRQHEFRADADALLLTRHPSGLARALIKMTAGGKATFRMDPTVSHLYVVDPLQPKLWSRIFATQPPVEERLAALVRMTGLDPRELQEVARAVKSRPL
jgi:heat shock protein HtpX